MAELLGVVASIVGIAGVGIKLSKTLYVVGEKHVHAGHNINRIATNVTLFSSMLKQFASVLQEAGSLHSPEALETAKQIVDECHGVFSEIGNIVLSANEKSNRQTGAPVGANDRKRRLSVMQKVKWHFEQPKVEWLTAQLEYLKTTLSVLIQTLHLAAFLAKTKEAEQVTEVERQKINEERIHVETLIVARQLSVVILQQFEKTQEKQQRSGRVSPADSEATLDARQTTIESQPQPKLLTQHAEGEDMSLVRLGGGNLAFLDRVVSPPTDAVFSVMQPSPTCSPIIDQLLGRMTRLDELEVNVNEKKKSKSIDLEDQALVEHVAKVNSIQKEMGSNRQPPDLKLQQVESNDPEDQQWGNNETLSAPPRYGPARGVGDRTPSPTSGPVRPVVDGPPTDTKLGLTRSSTFSEESIHADGQPQPTSTMSKQPPQSRTVVVNPPLSSYTPVSPLDSPTSTRSYSATADWYSNQRGIAAAAAATTATAATIANAAPVHSKPYGSRNSSPGPATPTSDDEDEHNMEQRLGLGIPWRIRIGPNKYFDFLDDRLVGPRTPYLPSEPLSWVYSHDNAHTEISSSWVAEEAIAEARYSYTEFQPGDEARGDFLSSGDRKAESRWKVFSPLKFREVEKLVERTIDLHKQRQTVPNSFKSAPPPPQQRANLYPPPHHLNPGMPLQNPGIPPQNPAMPPQTHRSASFSTFPARTARSDWERGAQEPYSPTARNVPQWSYPTAGPFQGSSYTQPHVTRPSAPPHQSSYNSPRNYRENEWHDWNDQNPRLVGSADRGHPAEIDIRDGRDREVRPPSRGKEKPREMNKKVSGDHKKKKSSSLGVTMAKIGGLAALLEGLDSV